jgi:hypothetical protein
MDTTNNTSAEVSRVAVQLPPFYAEEPEIWFSSVEAQFALAGMTEERTKFYHILSRLDHRYAREVRDIVASHPARTLHTFENRAAE